ncbi:MAG: porin family protein [Prolixibacteraceae bacterium]|nr:porin family protein [Prolixibacteraceae bacterium]
MKKSMKLLAVVVLLTMTTQFSFAQTIKGNFVLSGGTGLQFVSSNVKSVYDGETDYEDKISSLSVMPSFAYFVIDNLAIGLNSIITTATSKDEDGDKDVSISTMILPTALYYFPMEGKIRPLVQVGIGLSSETYKYIPKSGDDEKMSYSGIAFNFGAGFAYFFKENISLNFGVSYTKANLTDGDDDKSEVKQGNFASNIGFSIYF